jgi:hypothetical protein
MANQVQRADIVPFQVPVLVPAWYEKYYWLLIDSPLRMIFKKLGHYRKLKMNILFPIL